MIWVNDANESKNVVHEDKICNSFRRSFHMPHYENISSGTEELMESNERYPYHSVARAWRAASVGNAERRMREGSHPKAGNKTWSSSCNL
ncbi:hypothetical protein OUZ56_000405 [Daphnia magna]|uniref:Uncharacterized protein n=1 Tax=Daphnia magna TaxID=35525 RepID=A0ABR0A099_9CRUS|nr:hypothetical protein OUZ56_000405 [Daphnia magna]